ncbi:hypothetical protein NFI96_028369 [Prochilodus magdalenae]|nr:hypothetical protein NFI96_028369 [Prochilodus magdalenae]
MSNNNSYRSSPDDYRSRQDTYSDSCQRESDVYKPRARSASREMMHSAASSSRPADSAGLMPGKALSFLQSCGLDLSDLSLLAELPEHLITVETLPKLLSQLKESKLPSTSSSTSNTTQPSANNTWESGSQNQAFEYPLDQSTHTPYPLPPDQIESWQDRWGNPRKTGSVPSSVTSSKSSAVVDYGHSRDGHYYYNEQAYTSAASVTSSSTVSGSYADYNKGPSQNFEPLPLSSTDPPFKVPTRKEASDFHGILPPVFPCTCVLCNFTVHTDKDWSLHTRGAQHAHSLLELVKKYPEWDLNVDSAKRNECQATQQSRSAKTGGSEWDQNVESVKRYEYQTTQQSRSTKTRDSYQNVPSRHEASAFQGRTTSAFGTFPEKDWAGHVKSTDHVNRPHKFVEKNLGWNRNIDSARRNEVQVTPQAELFVKQEPVHSVPTRKEASDFCGKVPPVFPYACVLCDITVLSEKDWSVHITGAQHANGQLMLAEKYPKWNQKVNSARRNECDTTSQLIAQAKSTETKGGVQNESKKKISNKEKRSSSKKTPTHCGRVVCVTFVGSSMDEGYLRKLFGQFGAVVKVMMFPTTALVEMGSNDQSEDIVKYFTDNPLDIDGKRIQFSISTIVKFLHSSRVVSFSPLPAGDGVTSELMATAKRFGSVKNSLFLPNRGYVEMTDLADANKLVEHYAEKPLKLKGKTIQVTFSSEYDTLINQERAQSPGSYSRKMSSPERHNSQRDSPRPKRRRSSESTHSSRYSSSNERDDREHSRERSKMSSKTAHSSTNDKPTKTQSEEAEVKISARNDIVASMDSDSDLEGLAVIADDGEELLHDDDDDDDGDGGGGDGGGGNNSEPIDDQQKTCKEYDQTDDKTSRRSKENSPSGTVDLKSVHSKAQEDDASETSNNLKKDQKIEEQNDTEEEDFDFPESLENCITLDELVEDCSDYQESNEQNSSAQVTEDTLGEELKTKCPPFPIPCSDAKENKRLSEFPKEESTESTVAETKPIKHEPINIDDQSLEQQDEEKDTDDIKEKLGKVLDVRNLPKAEDYTESDFLNIVKRYGEVKHHVLICSSRKGFVEMVHASDAERIAADSENKDVALRGNVLKIKVSEKHSSLPTEGFNIDSDSDEEESGERANSEESTSDNQSASEQPNEPLGTEFVRPVVGYLCNLCNVIYASEEEAKDKHCRSLSHHEKLKEHKEKSA